tara:strand:- start:166 stop:1128 length:963 start_codon:yes stop_codon:yes gene_type:complete
LCIFKIVFQKSIDSHLCVLYSKNNFNLSIQAYHIYAKLGWLEVNGLGELGLLVDSYAAQFEAVSGLAEWRYWAITLLGTTILLTASYFIEINGNSLIDEAMYIVIAGLGVVMLVLGYKNAVFLDRQKQLASEQVRILEQVSSFDDFFEKASPSIFQSHISNLYEIALTHTDVSQDNLIEILHFRLAARNKTVNLFASVLITLGLIGTIVGLIIMMSDLARDIRQGAGGDPAQLMRDLFDPQTGALGGLSTAFITTLLAAVIGGVILRVLSSVVDSSAMRYSAHLAELTEVYVLPQLRKLAINQNDCRHEEDTSVERELPE